MVASISISAHSTTESIRRPAETISDALSADIPASDLTGLCFTVSHCQFLKAATEQPKAFMTITLSKAYPSVLADALRHLR